MVCHKKEPEPVLFTEVIHVTSPPAVVRDTQWMTNRIKGKGKWACAHEPRPRHLSTRRVPFHAPAMPHPFPIKLNASYLICWSCSDSFIPNRSWLCPNHSGPRGHGNATDCKTLKHVKQKRCENGDNIEQFCELPFKNHATKKHQQNALNVCF